jgi:hypothetical protein
LTKVLSTLLYAKKYNKAIFTSAGNSRALEMPVDGMTKALTTQNTGNFYL